MSSRNFLRTLLALSRPARLPTVWSNCLAGWWLGRAGNQEQLPFLLVGATCLYLGTAFLNDAFDVSFDRQHRRDRPVPAGAIGLRSVWRWGLGLLIAGTLLLFWAGTLTGSIGLALVVFGVFFNAAHRYITFAPVLIGICRFLLYLLGASVAIHQVTGWAVWSALAVGAYATGQAFFRRWSAFQITVSRWPAFLLALPILLALVLNAGPYREPALLLSVVLGLWTVRSLRYAFAVAEKNLAHSAALLLAGMVLVDWLACCNGPRELGFMFISLFLASLALQQMASAR